jgi:hypothetical protein
MVGIRRPLEGRQEEMQRSIGELREVVQNQRKNIHVRHLQLN